MSKNPTPQNILFIFAAASFDPRLKIGACCKLALPVEICLEPLSADKLKTLAFVIKDFAEITPTRLELETILWALESIRTDPRPSQVTLCCDFKAIQGLLEKRERLEKTNYEGLRPGTTVINADLFQAFYKQHDRLNIEILSTENLLSNESLKGIFSEVVLRAQTALKEKIKVENKVAEKWF